MAEVGARPPKILVLGGARSGKSAFAQAEAEASGRARVFIATAEPFDDEMRERIARHASSRSPSWRTREAPLALGVALAEEAAPDTVVVVDCLTVWLGNLMFRGDDPEPVIARLLEAVGALKGPAIFVSNEVGMGIVPEGALGRRFRDLHGHLNQKMAAASDHVVLLTAGVAQVLKPAAPPALWL